MRGSLSHHGPPTTLRSARLAVTLLALCGCSPAAAPAVPTSLPPQLAATATATELPPAPSPSSTPTPVCAEAAGRVVEDSYPATLVEGQVPFRIYLPPCAGETGERLPVLYLLHGYPFDESHWDTLGIDEMVEAWIGAEQAPRLALVMPLLPEPLFTGPKSGGPGSYEAELLQGLMPAVEAKYPVARSPQQRAIAGISRGGVWALEIGMRHPEVFASVAALSPALSVNYAAPQYDPLVLVGTAEQLPQAVYLAAGARDWARPKTEELSEKLQSRAVPVLLEIVPGGHDAGAWLAALPGLLTYVTSGW